MRRRDPKLYLDDIIEAIEKITTHTARVSRDQFFADDVLQAAVVRWIEIIGEASAHISPTVRKKNPDIPWQDIAGMRNRLIHGYFQVDPRRVWTVVSEELTDLREKVRSVRDQLEEKPG